MADTVVIDKGSNISIGQCQAAANAASGYATAAKTSETNAAASLAQMEQDVATGTATIIAEAIASITADKNTATQAATSASTSETNASTSEANAKISETNAANSATSASNSATSAAASAALAFGTEAEAWSATTTYNYPTVVAYTDGYTYRCIGTSVIGDIPSESANWVKAAWVANDFFDIDTDGGLMPALSPTYSADFELDGNGDITPKL